MSSDYEKDMAELEAYLDTIPGMPKAPTNQLRRQPGQQYPHNPHDVPTIDAETMLMQRIMQGQTTTNYQQHAVAPTQRQVVRLREGVTYYKAAPTDMSPMPIAMVGGPITGVDGKEFILKNTQEYFVVESHTSAIDLSKIDRSMLKRMCAVEAPWTGVILVPESAIINVGQNNGPKILKG